MTRLPWRVASAGVPMLLALACGGSQHADMTTDNAVSAARERSPKTEQTTESVPEQSHVRPAADGRDPVRNAERYVGAMETLATLFETHRNDCVALSAVLKARSDERVQVRAVSMGEAHQRAGAVPELRTRLARATRSIMDVSMKCSESPEFTALYNSLSE